uniref:Uncharacterized protein n=1 Tax=Ixodes ricinus TaxID=34613 RepID=A0A6B0TXR3_IXORI
MSRQPLYIRIYSWVQPVSFAAVFILHLGVNVESETACSQPVFLPPKLQSVPRGPFRRLQHWGRQFTLGIKEPTCVASAKWVSP